SAARFDWIFSRPPSLLGSDDGDVFGGDAEGNGLAALGQGTGMGGQVDLEGARTDFDIERQGLAAIDEVGDGAGESVLSVGAEGKAVGADEQTGIAAVSKVLAEVEHAQALDFNDAAATGAASEEISGTDEVGDELCGR